MTARITPIPNVKDVEACLQALKDWQAVREGFIGPKDRKGRRSNQLVTIEILEELIYRRHS